MGSRRGKDSGFSLMELMVVVMLMGALLAIVAPSVFRYVQSSKALGASNTLVADLRYGRSLANTQRKSYQILFSGSSYTLCSVSPATTITRRTLPRGVTCSSSGTATFYAYGLTTPITVRMIAGRDTSTVVLSLSGGVSRG